MTVCTEVLQAQQENVFSWVWL